MVRVEKVDSGVIDILFQSHIQFAHQACGRDGKVVANEQHGLQMNAVTLLEGSHKCGSPVTSFECSTVQTGR